MFTVANHMFVNSDTLASLQILRSQLHPNSQVWGPGKSSASSKESLSVFGLFRSLASSPQGKAKLRQVFLRPVIDLSVIQDRQDTISVFIQEENSEILATIKKTLRKIRNVANVIVQLRKGVELPPGRATFDKSVWTVLQGFAAFSLQLRDLAYRLSLKTNLRIINKVSLC